MPIYKFSLLERFIGNPSRSRCGFKNKLMSLNKRGVLVEYDNEDELDEERLKTCLVGVRDGFCYIEEPNIEEAIKNFHTEYVGAKTGKRIKALKINKKIPILEFPYCDKLFKDKKGRFHCKFGEDDEDFCDCVLSGADADDDCPIDIFIHQVNHRLAIKKSITVKPYGRFFYYVSAE